MDAFDLDFETADERKKLEEEFVMPDGDPDDIPEPYEYI